MTRWVVAEIVICFLVAQSFSACAQTSTAWSSRGDYRFSKWDGPELGVFYSMPPNADPRTPVLIVIPGARRNADEYRDQWHEAAIVRGFIVLTLQGSRDHFPGELEYNAGGVVSAEGRLQPEPQWLFSAVEPLFDDFVTRFGSTRKSYSLYGHSAGGGFVHRFMLMKPEARVDRAVAANPAFVTMPNRGASYPFGLNGLQQEDDAISTWFSKPMCVMLGSLDRGPRTKPLSNGPEALEQGPNVFSRGLLFYHAALVTSKQLGVPLTWDLRVVDGVGHSNTAMVSTAADYLFPQ